MAREKAITNQLVRLLASARRPLYVIDNQRRIAYLNPACAEWLGAAAEELIGQRCDYRAGNTGDGAADLAARLCPPPEAFAGAIDSGRVSFPRGPEVISTRRAQYLRLGGDADDASALLVVVSEQDLRDDPTEQLLTESESSLLHHQLQRLTDELRLPYRLSRLAGKSLAMERVRRQLSLAVQTGCHVQIVGPVGSGREHLARTIHCGEDLGADKPLMPLSCPLLDFELLQATILAFLTRTNRSACERAATLLLLDLDQLQMPAQVELLGFLRLPTFNLRTIATTRRPLLHLPADEFLPELAYRLSTLVIELPPLAHRREDIPLLCQQFVEEFNAAGGKQLSGLSPAALDRLSAMPWPGNVDELAEVIQEMCTRAEGPQITEADLTRRVQLVTSAAAYPPPREDAIRLDDFLLDVERELLRRALRQANDNKAKAARLLGISRQRLLSRLAQLKLGEPAAEEVSR